MKYPKLAAKPISWFFDEPPSAPLSYDRQLQEQIKKDTIGIFDEIREMKGDTHQLLSFVEILKSQTSHNEILKKLDTLLKRTKLQDILEEKNGSIHNGSTANNSHAASHRGSPQQCNPIP